MERLKRVYPSILKHFQVSDDEIPIIFEQMGLSLTREGKLYYSRAKMDAPDFQSSQQTPTH